MGSRPIPDPKNERGDAGPPAAARDRAPRVSTLARAAVVTRRLWFRLSRPVGAGMPPVWSPQMTWLAMAALCLTLFAGLFDPLVQPLAYRSGNGVLRFLAGITDAAKSGWYIVPAIIVIAIIGLLDWRGLRRASRKKLMTAYGQAAYILAAVAIPGMAATVVKQIVGRARPRAMEEAGVYGFSPFEFDHLYQSFPSGHATTAGSLAVILMLWHPRWRWVSLLTMIVLASARLPAGAHYPSDVVGGFSLGAVLALLIARWLARRRAVFVFRSPGPFPNLIG